MAFSEIARSTPHHLHLPGEGHARRLKHFFLQNGRRIHIASTPEEQARLLKELTHEDPNANFDVLIQGTPEAHSVIRELHAHREARRDSLRLEHGEVHDQFEKVKEELDHLSGELNKITDHGVNDAQLPSDREKLMTLPLGISRCKFLQVRLYRSSSDERWQRVVVPRRRRCLQYHEAPKPISRGHQVL